MKRQRKMVRKMTRKRQMITSHRATTQMQPTKMARTGKRLAKEKTPTKKAIKTRKRKPSVRRRRRRRRKAQRR